MTHKTAIWQGIICPEPPELRDNHPKIARQATNMAKDRSAKYPGRVSRGQISAAAAAEEIAIWSLIAADWHWINTGEGAPAPIDSLVKRREAIDTALANIVAIVKRDGNFTPALNFAAHLIIAMRWHLEPERGTRDVYFFASITHQLRREAAIERQARERKAA